VPAREDDLNARLARISEQIANLGQVSADAREELLLATEQLVQQKMAELDVECEKSRHARHTRGTPTRNSKRRESKRQPDVR
jgi:hypothetical protein